MAPAPRAARSADSAVIFLTTPATAICSPPPADEVDRYKSTPLPLPSSGFKMPSSLRSLRPVNSSTSVTALRTPIVTSSNGDSTVVGASPRTIRRYSLSLFSISIALVVVEPQSVARIERISLPAAISLPSLTAYPQPVVIQKDKPVYEQRHTPLNGRAEYGAEADHQEVAPQTA